MRLQTVATLSIVLLAFILILVGYISEAEIWRKSDNRKRMKTKASRNLSHLDKRFFQKLPHYNRSHECGLGWENPKGRTHDERRIAGGYDAHYKEFPSVLHLHPLNCTGVLLTPRTVLLTANCVADILPPRPGHPFGEVDIKHDYHISWFTWDINWPFFEDEITDIYASFMCVSENYLRWRSHDFAIAVLNEDFDYLAGAKINTTRYNNVTFVCLPNNSVSETTDQLFLVGFGATKYVPENGGGYVYPQKLQALKVEYKEKFDSRLNISFGYKDTPGTVCKRDIGDPIIGFENGLQVLYGITTRLPPDSECAEGSAFENSDIIALDVFQAREEIIKRNDFCIDKYNAYFITSTTSRPYY